MMKASIIAVISAGIVIKLNKDYFEYRERSSTTRTSGWYNSSGLNISSTILSRISHQDMQGLGPASCQIVTSGGGANASRSRKSRLLRRPAYTQSTTVQLLKGSACHSSSKHSHTLSIYSSRWPQVNIRLLHRR